MVLVLSRSSLAGLFRHSGLLLSAVIAATGCAGHPTGGRAAMKETPKILVLLYNRDQAPGIMQDEGAAETTAGFLGGLIGGAIAGAVVGMATSKELKADQPIYEKMAQCRVPDLVEREVKEDLSRHPGWTMATPAELAAPDSRDSLIRLFFEGKGSAEEKSAARRVLQENGIDYVLLLDLERYGIHTVGVRDKPTYDLVMSGRLIDPGTEIRSFWEHKVSARNSNGPYIDLASERLKSQDEICTQMMLAGAAASRALAEQTGVPKDKLPPPRAATDQLGVL